MENQVNRLQNNSKDGEINPIWKKIYKQVLESKKEVFPTNFWEENVEEKAIQLLRYYAYRKNIPPKFISYRDPETLAQNAKLEEPIKKAYLGRPELLLARTFSEVTLEDFHWDNSRKPLPKEVENFRNHYCTWNEIGKYYGLRPEKIKNIVEENDLKTPRKQENSFIDAPVLEVELFWNLVKKLQHGSITLEKMFEIMKKEVSWEERRTNTYLCRYNVKKEVGRLKSQKRAKKPLKEFKGRLNPTERLFAEKSKTKLQKLKSHGADFIDGQNNIIEVKKSLHKYNIKHALLQLIFAKDTLEETNKLKIYTRNYKLSQEELSAIKRMLNFYNIEIYEHNSIKDKFVKKDIK